MDDLTTKLAQAVDLHLRGKTDQAFELAQQIIGPSRGTPHAASVHRHQADFLLALGHVDPARRTAEEAGRLARATRHPGEILAATITVLRCDLYDGQVAGVHKQLSELIELAPRQARPLAFMGEIMLLVGKYEQTLDMCEKSRTMLDDQTGSDDSPTTTMARAKLLLLEGRAELGAGNMAGAESRLNRVLHTDIPGLVPHALAQAMLGLTRIQLNDPDGGQAYTEQALGMGRKISGWVYGQCLTMSARGLVLTGKVDRAREQLQAAVGLLTHPLERQEAYFLLGRLAAELDESTEARQAYRMAANPSTETHYGRRAVQALHSIVGLHAV